MLHKSRVWHIQECASPEEIAGIITRFDSMVLCTAFRVGRVTLLNDSTSEDSLQEYALCLDNIQVDSITTSWCKGDRLAEIIRNAIDGRYEGSKTYGEVDFGPSAKHGEGDPDGMCHLCA